MSKSLSLQTCHHLISTRYKARDWCSAYIDGRRVTASNSVAFASGNFALALDLQIIQVPREIVGINASLA